MTPADKGRLTKAINELTQAAILLGCRAERCDVNIDGITHDGKHQDLIVLGLRRSMEEKERRLRDVIDDIRSWAEA